MDVYEFPGRSTTQQELRKRKGKAAIGDTIRRCRLGCMDAWNTWAMPIRKKTSLSCCLNGSNGLRDSRFENKLFLYDLFQANI